MYQQIKFQGKSLILSQIAAFVLFVSPPLGGLLYVAGSIIYWPSFTSINPSAGGILFTLGSAMLVLSDFAGSYLQSEFSFSSPLKNIGSCKSFCTLLGNTSYVIGSIYFLPNFPVIVGEDIFIIGSIFNFIPQILCIWGVCSLNIFTAPFYIKMIKFKKTIIWMNICLAIGCASFFLGTFLFKNQREQSSGLYKQAVVMFAVGSFFFFLGPMLAIKMRKKRLLDPLSKYHEQIHRHFLPNQNTLFYHLLKKEKKEKKKNNHIIISMQPSITISNNKELQETSSV